MQGQALAIARKEQASDPNKGRRRCTQILDRECPVGLPSRQSSSPSCPSRHNCVHHRAWVPEHAARGWMNTDVRCNKVERSEHPPMRLYCSHCNQVRTTFYSRMQSVSVLDITLIVPVVLPLVDPHIEQFTRAVTVTQLYDHHHPQPIQSQSQQLDQASNSALPGVQRHNGPRHDPLVPTFHFHSQCHDFRVCLLNATHPIDCDTHFTVNHYAQVAVGR
ncbi:hypothetical protein C8Q74DRAFT_157923 [Fomes fomentarius]|nr:hypothetical protein C8Q74DRAFT_157923 [Fomes fomentarius]